MPFRNLKIEVRLKFKGWNNKKNSALGKDLIVYKKGIAFNES